MLIQSARPKRTLLPSRAAKVLFGTLLFWLSACSDGDLFTPNTRGGVRLTLEPRFSANVSAVADISRIRLTVKRLPSGEVVSQQTVPAPSGDSWNVDLEVPPNSDLEILIELISVGPNNSETIEYSGEVRVSVTSGPQPPPPPVEVVVGPPENLRITSVAITPRNQDLLEGEEVQLSATVQGTTTPTLAWTSLNGSIATVDNTGKVTAKAPGQAVIVVMAGSKSDNITVNVSARATRIDITPGAPVLNSLGADVTFTGVVRDARNAEVPGLGITWSITDADVAAALGNGVFRARKNGTTTVTAMTVQRGRPITATATLKVEQKAVSIVLHPTSATFSSFGQTQQFNVGAKDANGNDVSGLAFAWSSSNQSVATVDASGLVTARGNGETKIKVDAAGASAEATVNVQQMAATLTITPQQATLRSINETVQLRAEMKDARGNVMNAPVTWTSSVSGIAEVDANGLVTAKGDGPVVIGATGGGQRANATIFVERVGARITLNEPPKELNAGSSFQLRGTVVDANGFELETQTITWASNKPSVAVVNSTGLVTGVSAGEAEITAKSGNAFGVARFVIKGSTGFHIANGRILLYNADGGTASDFKNRLVATGVFTADKIDLMDMSSPLPTVTALSAYGCVLAWTNYAPYSPTSVQIGDRLREYVDAGGKVVLAVYALGVPSRPWDLEGGIMSAGYSPLTLSENQSNDYQHMLDFTTALTSHPILEGVTSFTYFTNTNYTRPTLSTGATLVAKDNHGDPLIAVNANGHVVAINVWPGFPYHGNTASKPFVDRAFANACR